nr:hypothetical protein [Rhizobium terrae]
MDDRPVRRGKQASSHRPRLRLLQHVSEFVSHGETGVRPFAAAKPDVAAISEGMGVDVTVERFRLRAVMHPHGGKIAAHAAFKEVARLRRQSPATAGEAGRRSGKARSRRARGGTGIALASLLLRRRAGCASALDAA